MRTTIELPDELLARAKSRAAIDRTSLKKFFIEAVEQKLAPPVVKKVRRPPPSIGDPNGPKIKDLTSAQIEDLLFGHADDFELGRR